eukprot:5176882-Amphidinium_carterae.1
MLLLGNGKRTCGSNWTMLRPLPAVWSFVPPLSYVSSMLVGPRSTSNGHDTRHVEGMFRVSRPCTCALPGDANTSPGCARSAALAEVMGVLGISV